MPTSSEVPKAYTQQNEAKEQLDNFQVNKEQKNNKFGQQILK